VPRPSSAWAGISSHPPVALNPCHSEPFAAAPTRRERARNLLFPRSFVSGHGFRSLPCFAEALSEAEGAVEECRKVPNTRPPEARRGEWRGNGGCPNPRRKDERQNPRPCKHRKDGAPSSPSARSKTGPPARGTFRAPPPLDSLQPGSMFPLPPKPDPVVFLELRPCPEDTMKKALLALLPGPNYLRRERV